MVIITMRQQDINDNIIKSLQEIRDELKKHEERIQKCEAPLITHDTYKGYY